MLRIPAMSLTGQNPFLRCPVVDVFLILGRLSVNLSVLSVEGNCRQIDVAFPVRGQTFMDSKHCAIAIKTRRRRPSLADLRKRVLPQSFWKGAAHSKRHPVRPTNP